MDTMEANGNVKRGSPARESSQARSVIDDVLPDPVTRVGDYTDSSGLNAGIGFPRLEPHHLVNGDTSAFTIVVVQNWFEELRRLVPVN